MRAATGGAHGLAIGCGALALLACLAVVYATPRDAYWVVDCGNKAVLAQRLLDTRFAEIGLDYPAAELDPKGLAFPIPAPFALRREGRFVSQYPLAYPALAAPFLAALGPAGLRWPAALGVAACAALFAAWTASVLGRRWAAFGALSLALATPLFFYGAVVWEHSLTVALPLASVVVLRRPTAARAAGAGALVALACALRAELALMGVALAAALAARVRRAAPVLALGAGALPVLAAWLGANALAYGHLLGVHVTENVGVSGATAAAGAVGLLRRTGALLAGFGWGPLESAALGLGALACLAGGALAAQRGRGEAPLPALLVAAGVVACGYGSLRIATARIPILTLVQYNGLLVQVPWLALAGLGAVRILRDDLYAPLRVGVGAGLGFLVVAIPLRVTLTQFETGAFWGPRMLMPGLPGLLACALVALHARGRTRARIGAGALAAAGLLASAVSVHLLNDQKLEVRSLQRVLTNAPQPVVVTNHPALGQQLAAIWGVKPLLYAESDAELARLGRRLAARNVEELLLVYRTSGGRAPALTGALDCRHTGSYRGRHVAVIFDFELFACRPQAEATPPSRAG